MLGGNKRGKKLLKEKVKELMQDFGENATKNFALGYLAIHSAGMVSYLKLQGASATFATEAVIIYAGAAAFAGITMIAYSNLSEGAQALDPRRYIKGEVTDYLKKKGVEIYEDYVDKIVNDILGKF